LVAPSMKTWPDYSLDSETRKTDHGSVWGEGVIDWPIWFRSWHCHVSVLLLWLIALFCGPRTSESIAQR